MARKRTLVTIGLLLGVQCLSTAAVGDTSVPKTGQERIVCRTFPVTGSLVRKTKICKSVHDWEAERELLSQGPGVSDACRDRANGGFLCQ
ncbi:hypothetical protein SAMN05444678_1052 [Sphingomonas sp. YR710]|jgi:selenophosphate synthetase-related protein|uniref:hypothetical protein n=1 Tax=Sphingomonas sp. YR710 TaxID=1882773 RepID=UPI000891C74A|nr:hypothetical protein [Sphingomonas sp. YR710]SDC70735.1 hypothetical protein SAMN05444678_1052 [Sphingomonas sp. YR710]